MKFNFKIQQYQTDAVEAVVKVFNGQGYHDKIKYIRDLGKIKPNGTQMTLNLNNDEAGYYDPSDDKDMFRVMSKLNVDQKTIKDLFQSKKSDFLIPDYQRPYAWGEAECRTLWDDIFSFAIPDEGKTEFDSNSEYFLGPIVTFRNEEKLEVIDGQQRLTTLMLLLRAFYSKFGHMQDKASVSTKQNIEKCLWKTDEFGEPDMTQLKIDSEVATDNDKDEFLEILRTGTVSKEMKSRYAANFRFFQDNIETVRKSL